MPLLCFLTKFLIHNRSTAWRVEYISASLRAARLILGLRLIRGISYEQFEKQYGRSLPEVYGPVITQNIADGLLREYTEESGERFLALTEKGLDVSNYVMAQFLF